jgi:hypothetical protein
MLTGLRHLPRDWTKSCDMPPRRQLRAHRDCGLRICIRCRRRRRVLVATWIRSPGSGMDFLAACAVRSPDRASKIAARRSRGSLRFSGRSRCPRCVSHPMLLPTGTKSMPSRRAAAATVRSQSPRVTQETYRRSYSGCTRLTYLDDSDASCGVHRSTAVCAPKGWNDDQLLDAS